MCNSRFGIGFGLLILAILAACAPAPAGAKPVGTQYIVVPANTDAQAVTGYKQPAGSWQVELKLTGGVSNEEVNVNVSSTGKTVVEDMKNNKEAVIQMSEADLSNFEQLVGNTVQIQPPASIPACTDCRQYELSVITVDKNFKATFNDTNLSTSGLQPIIDAIMKQKNQALSGVPGNTQAWQVELKLSGGIAGVQVNVNADSTGKVVVEDAKTNKQVELQMSTSDLANFDHLVRSLGQIQPPATSPACLDCMQYELSIMTANQNFQATVDDTNLGDSGLQPIVDALMKLENQALSK